MERMGSRPRESYVKRIEKELFSLLFMMNPATGEGMTQSKRLWKGIGGEMHIGTLRSTSSLVMNVNAESTFVLKKSSTQTSHQLCGIESESMSSIWQKVWESANT